MAATLASLATLVGGECRGNPDTPISGGATLEQAGPTEIAFVQDARHFRRLKAVNAAALVMAPADADDSSAAQFAKIIVADPHVSFVQMLLHFKPPRPRPARGISPAAWIHPAAKIGAECFIAPGVTIGAETVIGDGCDIHPGVVIGDACRLGNEVTVYPNAVLYAETVLEDRVIIHANAVLGADGFGYRFVDRRFVKIPQLGSVRIEADAEIGVGTAVDRGAIGATVIGAGSKIDNMVQIAHNCEIGQHNAIAAQVGLAGSCSTGDYVRLAGQVGIKDHVRLNTGCMVGAKGGVHKDIPAGEIWIGYPAEPEAEQKRLVFTMKRLPQMREQLKELQARVTELTAELAALKEANEPPQLRAAG